MQFSMVTLGCDKNTVDSERYIASLVEHGGTATDDLGDADVIVVNTCGFIDAAKAESIDAIVNAGRFKDGGRCKAVIAVGCMVERHKDELVAALPEVDAFLGASECDRLVPMLIERGLIDSEILAHPGERVYAGTLPHVRYLKVSEGCDHGCAFCAIPLMRGRHRSFAVADVVREAQLLELQGALEVNLVAQDLAHYGRDLRDGIGLADLLATLRPRDVDSLVSQSLPVFGRDHAAPARGDRGGAAHPAVSRHADATRVGPGARGDAAPGAAGLDSGAGGALSGGRPRPGHSHDGDRGVPRRNRR